MKHAKRHNIPRSRGRHRKLAQQAQTTKAESTQPNKRASLHIPAQQWQTMMADLQYHQAGLAMHGVFLDGLTDVAEYTERAERKVKWLLWLFGVSRKTGRRQSA